ncbi:MAG: (2Fe-2S)-binding protein [Ancylobacter novellus]|uniref:(2Fe-2S)-binding protein n=1 Tax=Ancylobacter novellus TaxID=921 RepID=A0A2W5KDX1_ANCNO|nr:MAG: (2Fe-2S)-binding protein [Ancylobacter novellus]
MSWTYLCDASEVAPNTLKLVDAQGVPIVVANYGEGFRAMPPICPHMEEPLEESGVIAGCVLTCTKHLWAWNLGTMEMDGGETEKPLKTYDLKEEDGRLLAFVEEELTYDFDEEDDMDDDFFSKS